MPLSPSEKLRSFSAIHWLDDGKESGVYLHRKSWVKCLNIRSQGQGVRFNRRKELKRRRTGTGSFHRNHRAGWEHWKRQRKWPVLLQGGYLRRSSKERNSLIIQDVKFNYVQRSNIQRICIRPVRPIDALEICYTVRPIPCNAISSLPLTACEGEIVLL